jgi:hypothetical protein
MFRRGGNLRTKPRPRRPRGGSQDQYFLWSVLTPRTGFPGDRLNIKLHDTLPCNPFPYSLCTFSILQELGSGLPNLSALLPSDGALPRLLHDPFRDRRGGCEL